MTAADVIRMLLEMDQQCISGRPSVVGRAAEIVQALCEHAEGSLRDPALLGDYQQIDLSPVRAKRLSGERRYGVMGLAEENDQLRSDLEHAKTLVDVLTLRPKTILHRPGGRWDVFESDAEAEAHRRRFEREGDPAEAWNVSAWTTHHWRDDPQ